MTTTLDDLRSRLLESVFACVALLLLCTVVLAVQRQEYPVSWSAFFAVIAFGALAVLGAWWPRTALFLTVLGIFAYYAFNLPPLGMVLPATAALYITAARGRTSWAIGGALLLLVVSTYFRLTGDDDAARFTMYEYVTEVALAAAAIALGAATRLARQHKEQSVRIAELVATEHRHLADQRMNDERLRISRELHDTVGHQLTVATLHASVAAEELEHDGSPAARDAVDRVRTATAETLRELRTAVRAIRTTSAGVLPVHQLADTARSAGLGVEVNVGKHGPLPQNVEAAASGILTEAVTNVLRHAQATTLLLDVHLDGPLILTISDNGHGAQDDRLSTGNGIRGMRERAEMLGGTLELESSSHGTTVRATLPVETQTACADGVEPR